MAHVQLLLLARDERAVLRQLGSDGVIQLSGSSPETSIAPLSRQNRATELARLEQLAVRLASLGEALALPASAPCVAGFEPTIEQVERTLQAMERQLGTRPAQRQQLAQHLSEKQSAYAQAQLARELALPVATADSSFLYFVLGSRPVNGTIRLVADMSAVVIPLTAQGGRQRVLAVVRRSARAALDLALQQAGFQQEQLPRAWLDTTDAAWEDMQRDCEQAHAQLQQADEQLQQLAKELAPSWAAAACAIRTERCLLETAAKLPRTTAVTMITGWVPQASAPAITGSLRALTQGRCCLAVAPPTGDEAEDVPVLIRHARLLRPFAALVRGCGLPHYWEVEPTLFVAISFVLMFGMMFGDVGHGFILAASGLVALWAGRRENVRDAGVLLLSGGCASMLFGVLYGSYFGLAAARPYALWCDPLDGDPVRLMALAVGVGIVMITLGLLLNIINRCRRGDIIGALMGGCGVLGIMFYWGALTLLVSPDILRSSHLLAAALGLFLGVPMIGWLLRRPLELWHARRVGIPCEPQGWFAALAETLVDVFEVALSYLANTISFVRLAAYAMSHAALLLAAFLLAEAVRGLPGGHVWAILVIIFGNLGALLLEGLIAAMQALRLEYYEFFSKFYAGGGKAFTPFRLPVNSVMARVP
jgi:V/A-type H+-transporting ATPase subunit I